MAGFGSLDTDNVDMDSDLNRSAHWAPSAHNSGFITPANELIGDNDKSLRQILMEQEQQKIKHLKARNSSIIGPSDPKLRRNFLITLLIMIMCGSGNDFFVKTIYQILPGNDSGLSGLQTDHWAIICLTGTAFFVCSFAIVNGRSSFKQLTCQSLLRIMIPALMDLFVTGGRYLALVFLPAAAVTVLKNGLQLFFLSLIRAFFLHKKFGKHAWVGLFILFAGLLIVGFHDLLDSSDSSNNYTLTDSLIGVSLMFFVGMAGAIRNTIEEILLKDYNFHSDFMVGMESIFSLMAVLVTAIIVLIIDKNTQVNDIIPGIINALSIIGLTICLVLFMFSIYGKDTLQMKVTKLSSAMTRKLFQQLYPINTWILSLLLNAINSNYGESWDKFSLLELFGFIVVLYGTYIYYIQPPYGMPIFLRRMFNLEPNMSDKKHSLLHNDTMTEMALDSNNKMSVNRSFP